MKKVLFFIGLIVLGLNPCYSQLEISQLSNNTYVYTTYKDLGAYVFGSNSMIIVSDSGIILLDTPWDTTQFQPLLDSLTFKFHKPVVLCIATHYHDDRTAGLEFFAKNGIKTYSSFQTLELCKKFGEKKAEFYFLNDTTFEIGNLRIQTYFPGGGHTKDNIVVWIENEKILYAACFVKSTDSRNLGNLNDADLMHWSASLEKVKKKFPNPTYIIPGHQSWKDNNSIEHTLKLLEKQR